MMQPRGRAPFLVMVLGLAACDGSCGTRPREDIGRALAANDCPPDVATCVLGEVFVSVGAVLPPGEPCRRLSLGECERGCVVEGVALGYVGARELARGQLCRSPIESTSLQGGDAVAASTEIRCHDGLVQANAESVRCGGDCATDDVLEADGNLTLAQAAALLCLR